MKITQIELKDFHQFKDLTIDLTYPKGHKKEGQPLDKVCFIGQSGTGKTTLLKFVAAHFGAWSTVRDLLDQYDAEKISRQKISARFGELAFTSSYRKTSDPFVIERDIHDAHTVPAGGPVSKTLAKRYLTDIRERQKSSMIFFPADLSYEVGVITEQSNKILERAFDFRSINVTAIWQLVFGEVEAYQQQELRMKQQIANLLVETPSIDPDKIQEELERYKEWRNSAPNPIKQLAEDCLDQALYHLKLRVARTFDFDSKEDIGAIKIEDLNGHLVPYDLLSTGTKQIMLTAIPLYYLKPETSIILCDEPERSLYPSMQRFIINFYTSLTQNCQFFYATHSPIIASCFEPWEIVELKFNDEGYVVQDLYYKGERHVDNYTIIPSYLTYDLMLKEVFDLEDTHPQERSEKIAEVMMLRNQLRQFKSDGKMKTPEAKKVYAAYKDLAGKLFWDFDID